MKVKVLEPYGFCGGVTNAINIAIKTKKENPSKEVYVLGTLVHNAQAIKMLENEAIKTILFDNSSLEDAVKRLNQNSIVVLSAHGHSQKVEELLDKNKIEFVDATCPAIKKMFNIINKSIFNQNDVLYIGIANHEECKAALSISNKVHLVDYKNPTVPNIDSKTPLIVAQTTLSSFVTEKIVKKIKEVYPNAIFENGICGSSTVRQEVLLNLDEDVDGIIVVGDKTSNNSKTLFDLANSKYPNKRVLFVENEAQINKKDLLGLNCVVISSGASTPTETVLNIEKLLLD